ncbi:MAG: hypothetical protein Q4P22_06675 [Eubacteriales bacterium]|nr:hypothetical protein [Eubacteriales bacterium]
MAESVKFKDGRYLDADDVYDFEQKKTQKEINANVHSVDVNYTRQILFETTDDVISKTIEIPQDGYVQCSARTQNIRGSAFIRLMIGEVIVFEFSPSNSLIYFYAWTPMFFVKKGVKITVTLQTDSADGINSVYLYGLA